MTSSEKLFRGSQSSLFSSLNGTCNHFCVSGNNYTAIQYDANICGFLLTDLSNGTEIAKCVFLSPHCSFQGRKELLAIHSCHHSHEEIRVLAFAFDTMSQKYLINLITLRLLFGTANVIDEQELDVMAPKTGRNANMVQDEKGQLYCIVFWHSNNMQTTFHITSVNEALGIVNQKNLAENVSITSRWQNPFIISKAIVFIPFTNELSRLLMYELETVERQEFIFVIDDEIASILHSGSLSRPFLRKNHVLFYCYDSDEKCGHILALNWKSRTWHKYLTLKSHVLGGNTKMSITADDRLFLLGSCKDEICLQEHNNHLYTFGFHLLGKTLLPTISQLIAINSDHKVQIIHGPRTSGKATVMVWKAINILGMQPNAQIVIYVRNNSARKSVVSSLFKNYQNVLVREFDADEFTNVKNIPDNAALFFIDEPRLLSFKHKSWLIHRSGQTVISMNSLQKGLDHPRNLITWHCFSQLNNISSTEAIQANEENKENKTFAQEFKPFIKRARFAMDSFYPDWWGPSIEKETICIPACLDVLSARYLGPIESHAKGLDDITQKMREIRMRGQDAENVFLQTFQKLSVGGVLVSGFNTTEFAKYLKILKLYRKLNIQDVEIDAIFLHPLTGITIFEIKSTSQSSSVQNIRCTQNFKKAKVQIEKMKTQLPILFKNICDGQESRVPINYCVSFPFFSFEDEDWEFIDEDDCGTDSADSDRIANFKLIDQSFFTDPKLKFDVENCKLRILLIEQMGSVQLSNEAETQLQTITCALSAFRSSTFFSMGHNALEVHRILDSQLFNRKATKNWKPFQGTEEEGIFLTSEQLGIIGSKHRRQIICGPPGTGKTLIILMKALAAAKEEKTTNVRIVAKKMVCIKFQKLFDTNADKVVRFPIIGSDYSVKEDDDVFIDDAYFNDFTLTFLQKRLSSSGRTVVSFTGGQMQLTAFDLENRAAEYPLKEYRIYKITTVVRCSRSICEEWISNFPKAFYGHNIMGALVKKITSTSVDKCMKKIINEVHMLRGSTSILRQESREFDTIQAKNIAIITDNTYKCCLIRNFLASNGIPCGSIEEQLGNSELIAVTECFDALSLEWPIVIVAAHCKSILSEPFHLIAASRAMALLVIIRIMEANAQSMETISDESEWAMDIFSEQSDGDWILPDKTQIGSELQNLKEIDKAQINKYVMENVNAEITPEEHSERLIDIPQAHGYTTPVRELPVISVTAATSSPPVCEDLVVLPLSATEIEQQIDTVLNPLSWTICFLKSQGPRFDQKVLKCQLSDQVCEQEHSVQSNKGKVFETLNFRERVDFTIALEQLKYKCYAVPSRPKQEWLHKQQELNMWLTNLHEHTGYIKRVRNTFCYIFIDENYTILERMTAVSFAFACDALLYEYALIEDLSSISEHYQIMLDILFTDEEILNHLTAYGRKKKYDFGLIMKLGSMTRKEYKKTLTKIIQQLLMSLQVILQLIVERKEKYDRRDCEIIESLQKAIVNPAILLTNDKLFVEKIEIRRQLDELKQKIMAHYLTPHFLFPFSRSDKALQFSVEDSWSELRQITKASNTSVSGFLQNYSKEYDSGKLKNHFILLSGSAGIGKTILLKRLAEDWANGCIPQFDLVLYVEFRFADQGESIAQLVVNYWRKLLEPKIVSKMEHIIACRFRPSRLLFLLDGLDDAHEGQCRQLDEIFNSRLHDELHFNTIISSRQEKICGYNLEKQFFEIKVFPMKENEKTKFVNSYFATRKHKEFTNSANAIIEMLQDILEWYDPDRLFLTIICCAYQTSWNIHSYKLINIFHKSIISLLENFRRQHFSNDDAKFHQSLKLSNDQSLEEWMESVIMKKLCKLAFAQLVKRIARRRSLLKSNIELFETPYECIASYDLNNDADLELSDVQFLEAVGILVKEKALNGITKVKFRFIHESFQHYFAALFFCYWAGESENTLNMWDCTSMKMFINNIITKEFEEHLTRIDKKADIWQNMLRRTDPYLQNQQIFETQKDMPLHSQIAITQHCSNLKVLMINGSKRSLDVPINFGSWLCLESLTISNVKITSLCSTWTFPKSLEHVFFDRIECENMSFSTENPSIKTFTVNECHWNEQLVSFVNNLGMSRLEYWKISGFENMGNSPIINKNIAKIAGCFERLRNLSTLSLSNITVELHECWQFAPSLSTVKLENCNFQGSCPSTNKNRSVKTLEIFNVPINAGFLRFVEKFRALQEITFKCSQNWCEIKSNEYENDRRPEIVCSFDAESAGFNSTPMSKKSASERRNFCMKALESFELYKRCTSLKIMRAHTSVINRTSCATEEEPPSINTKFGIVEVGKGIVISLPRMEQLEKITLQQINLFSRLSCENLISLKDMPKLTHIIIQRCFFSDMPGSVINFEINRRTNVNFEDNFEFVDSTSSAIISLSNS